MNRFQNLPERIEKLKAHLKSRRGRRDFAAHQRLVDAQRMLAGAKASTMYSMTELLKNIYTDVIVPLDRAYVFAPNPVFSMIRKEPVVFRMEYVMPRGYCPDCYELIEITPNGADPKTTNRRQRLVLHPSKKTPGELCAGSGKDI